MRLAVLMLLCGGLLRLGAMTLQAWKMWWDDGSSVKIFHSERDKWSTIPARPGVQVVLTCYREEWKPGHPYRRILHGADWYWLDGEPQQSKDDGLPNGKWAVVPLPGARPGLTIEDDVFERYKLAAMEDATCALP